MGWIYFAKIVIISLRRELSLQALLAM